MTTTKSTPKSLRLLVTLASVFAAPVVMAQAPTLCDGTPLMPLDAFAPVKQKPAAKAVGSAAQSVAASRTAEVPSAVSVPGQTAPGSHRPRQPRQHGVEGAAD
jgi:hypothetical protein